MTTASLSAFYSGLLPFSGTIDFSNLSHAPTESEIKTLVEQSVNAAQWKRITNAKSTNHSMSVVTLSDDHYPSVLRDTPFAPPVLFFKGNLELLDISSVAIIGSRHCSKDSLSFTSRLAWAAHTSHTIIGGLTYGIEETAHQAILAKNNGSAQLIAVLEQGMNNIRGHRKKWMEQLLNKEGLIISAYPPDQPLQRWQYKERNRLLAALSETVILVEASKVSGSMSTALSAVELGKDVYAVPHHPNRTNGHGCLQLIEQGAQPLWDPIDLFGPQTTEHKLIESLTEPKSLQEIAEHQHLSPSDMLETLLELKQLGYIRQRGALWERL